MSAEWSAGTTVVVALVLLAVLGVVHIWTTGVRAGRKVERQVREVTRLGRVAAGAAITAALIAVIQWAVVTNTSPNAAWVLVLGAPALLAGVTVGRLLAVTTVHRTGHGQHPRRAGVRR
jgi:hypothetical protein